MTRLFYVMIVAIAAMLLAAPVWAAVPWPPNCTVAWYHAIDDSAIGVCPTGDFSQLDVTIRDQFNTGMVGQTVTVTFSSALVKAKPGGGQVKTAVTGVGGYVRIPLPFGVNNAGPIALKSNVTVTCQTVTIVAYTGKYVLSPDFNADYYVGSADFSLFGAYWNQIMLDCVSNFDKANPKVQTADYSIFGSHWHH